MTTYSYIDEKYIRQLSSYVDRFKDVGNGTYNSRCPYCGDSQKSLLKARGYFYISGNNRWRFKCHNCAINVSLSNILNFLSPSLYEEYRFEYFKENAPETKKVKNTDKAKTEVKELTVTDTNTVILNKKILSHMTLLVDLPDDNPGVAYIKGRNIPEERLCKLYYTEDLKSIVKLIPSYKDAKIPNMSGVIIPYFDQGILQCFQIRNIDPNSKMRYLTYDITENASHIYNFENINAVDNVYVFEGAFDSMFCHNAVAASGASIMQKLSKIKEINKRVIIVFDNDYKTNKEIGILLTAIIDNGYSVVLYNEEMNGYKDINQFAVSKNKSVEEITEYLQSCIYTDLNAKLFLASQKKNRGSMSWLGDSSEKSVKTRKTKAGHVSSVFTI